MITLFPRRHPSARTPRNRGLPTLGLALLLASGTLQASPTKAQEQPTPLQQLRALLGMARPISVGGSRGNSQAMCLLSPWIEGALKPSNAPGVVAMTRSGAPPIATAVPLDEVQILKGTTLLWRGRASSTAPLANPLAWPLQPLKPGESVLLKLRSQQASGGDFSAVELKRPLANSTAPLPVGADPSQALSILLQQGRNAEAIEVLFKGDLDGNTDLTPLARKAINAGCKGLSS